MKEVTCRLPIPEPKQGGLEFMGAFSEESGKLIIVRERPFSPRVADPLPNDCWVVVKTDSPNSKVKWLRKSELHFISQRDKVSLTIQKGDDLYYRNDLVCRFQTNDLRLFENEKEKKQTEPKKPELKKAEAAM